MSKLFSPFTVKNIKVKNRVVMPPMCMYSAEDDGLAMDYHYMHYGARAFGGSGLIIQEATGVERRGRISDNDLGIWDDKHIAGLKKLVEVCQGYGALMGIQLGHAGRKCKIQSEDVISSSPIAFNDDYKTPREITEKEIIEVINAFRDAARRSLKIGYDIVEVHGAHGYLINQFLSPITNKRTDKYGGSMENRARFLREVIIAIREEWPMEKPLCLRVTAEEYNEDGNHPEDLAEIINLIKAEGVDIIHVSSGGVKTALIDLYQGYQVKFAEIIRERTGMPVIAGGLIISPHMAEEILQNERADLVFIGRELLRNPNWPLLADYTLDNDLGWPKQYTRAIPKR